MKNVIKRVLREFGCEIKRYPSPDLNRRMKLLKSSNINLVFDVGANQGQYASLLFDLKYQGRIISFEPMSNAYKTLSDKSKKYKNWITENLALGNDDGEIEINISENLYSSSILEMLPNHLENAPQSRYVDKEKVKIFKLDSIYSNYAQPGNRVFLKIDTQGYEKNVLEGANCSLQKIQGIQLEMSLVPLYQNETLFLDMIAFLKSKGFKLYALENGFSSPQTGQLLQVDGIFFRNANEQ